MSLLAFARQSDVEMVVFYVRPLDFCSLFKVINVMGALIRTSIIYMEKLALAGFEHGPFDHELSA